MFSVWAASARCLSSHFASPRRLFVLSGISIIITILYPFSPFSKLSQCHYRSSHSLHACMCLLHVKRIAYSLTAYLALSSMRMNLFALLFIPFIYILFFFAVAFSDESWHTVLTKHNTDSAVDHRVGVVEQTQPTGRCGKAKCSAIAWFAVRMYM